MLWYLTFVSKTEFLGAAIVTAVNAELAVQRTCALGINPGGKVEGLAVANDVVVPVEFQDRILTMEDVDRWASTVRHVEGVPSPWAKWRDLPPAAQRRTCFGEHENEAIRRKVN